MGIPSRSGLTALACLLLAACEHSGPFQLGDYGPKGPLGSGNPLQLTYNPGQDLLPAWLHGDSSIVYTSERMDRADFDRCFAFMPGGGGTVSRYACHSSTADDSTNVFDEAVESADGRLAFIRSSVLFGVGRLGPDAQQLVVAPEQRPDDVTVLLTIPLTTTWGATYDGVSFLGWLGTSRLVMIGESVRYPKPCSSCKPDTVRTGIEIATLDFASTPQLTLVPGTNGASSVTLGATSDTIYFTRAGESAIYRYALSSGLADTVFDFGVGRVVRDIQFKRGTIAAIVDGRILDGGIIHLVDLAAGTDSALVARADTLLWFRRPALNADRRRVVAEGRRLILTVLRDPGGAFLGVDTTASGDRNLWLVQP